MKRWQRAITSPSLAAAGWRRPAARHALAVELRSAAGEPGHPTSYRLGYHCGPVSAAAI
jgi:hypothetical protein